MNILRNVTAGTSRGSPPGTWSSPTSLAAVTVSGSRWPISPAPPSTPRLPIARGQSRFPKAETAATRLAIIGMGKAGARELNYVSDVDVIFVAEAGGSLTGERAVRDRHLAGDRDVPAIFGLATEPALWEVDANLRPEGKDGALVRTLESHLAYYERWAKGWEFQALLKARPLAGDLDLGNASWMRWRPRCGRARRGRTSSSRCSGCASGSPRTSRGDEVDVQLKLGPGGLRDVEFTIQLLQLVHGQTDPRVRQRGTLPALARSGGARLHRPRGECRVLPGLPVPAAAGAPAATVPPAPHAPHAARAGGAAGARQGERPRALRSELTAQWQRTKTARARASRTAVLPAAARGGRPPARGRDGAQQRACRRAAGRDRLHRPAGRAAAHRGAHRGGVPAGRHPAQPPAGDAGWLAEGADPDHGLLAFRRLSDELGETHWYLRMLRDSSGAAHRLTQLLSGSRFVGDLLEGIPEAVGLARKR